MVVGRGCGRGCVHGCGGMWGNLWNVRGCALHPKLQRYILASLCSAVVFNV